MAEVAGGVVAWQNDPNPRWYRVQSWKLRRAQQALGRTLNGSRNHGKARLVVARLHQKIRNQRTDFLHKLSTELIRHNGLVSIEDLNVHGRAKGKLARSVLDGAGAGSERCSATRPSGRISSS